MCLLFPIPGTAVLYCSRKDVSRVYVATDNGQRGVRAEMVRVFTITYKSLGTLSGLLRGVTAGPGSLEAHRLRWALLL